MKACPVCGIDLEDTYLFCPEDGSPLGRPDTSALAEESPENQTVTASADKARVDPSGPVVLYCPACAAEYPLTFSECPVHGVTLTQHRIPSFVKPPAPSDQQATGQVLSEREPLPQQESQSAASHSGVIVENRVESLPLDRKPAQEPLVVKDHFEAQANDYENPPLPVEEVGPEPRSFRVAAIMIAVGLAVLSLVGLYALYVNATRRPTSQAARSAKQSPVATPESAFVPTPEAALDYREEPAASPKAATTAASDEGRDEKARVDKASVDKASAHAAATMPSKAGVQKVEERKPSAIPGQPPSIVTPTPVAARRSVNATDLVLPRGTYGLVDARLVRMRARQTPAGYRYDLTFNLQEQAGRVTQYDRLAVVTRSASGISHSEVMPFFHRLGAAGDLTFTLSVELKGRSEADWQGRIICTSTGTDNQGRPLRTSFGANVSP